MDDEEWIVFEGVHYRAEEAVGSVCGVCGCWSPWDLEPYLRRILLAPTTKPDDEGLLDVDPLNWDDATYFAAVLLDIADLTTHAGSIGYSWLTERGKELRGLVNGLA